MQHNIMYKFLLFVLFLSAAAAKHEFYDGHALYEVRVNTVEESKFLNELETELYIDIWSHAVPSRPGAVLVPKDVKDVFEQKLKSAGIDFKIEVINIKDALEEEDRLLSAAASRSYSYNKSRISLPFDRVFTYDQIDVYIDLLGEAYPDVVTVVNAGTSFEGRPIKYLKISSSNFQDASKPVVFMESLLHAREWVTQSATLYAIHKLVIDVTEQDLIRDIDWIILPIANPDGFVHTHEDYRFWRKNRATGYTIGNICMGVDLNRNFDVNWSTASSSLTCSDTFHGRQPFSESESNVTGTIMRENLDRLSLFLDIHSFGSWILYGFGNGNLPPNGEFLHFVGAEMGRAIDAVKLDRNPNYVVGNVAQILYDASGSAGDYATHLGVPLSYTYELPGYTPGVSTIFGFMVDPALIAQYGFETWEGIKTGARYALANYRMTKGL